ncbi:MAG TPA: hypothetical protein VFI65_02045, partial [Streptosporangiaceae bacterium]|nr:hypothetical protein [Streptosporangiaceae bacterium]
RRRRTQPNGDFLFPEVRIRLVDTKIGVGSGPAPLAATGTRMAGPSNIHHSPEWGLPLLCAFMQA